MQPQQYLSAPRTVSRQYVHSSSPSSLLVGDPSNRVSFSGQNYLISPTNDTGNNTLTNGCGYVATPRFVYLPRGSELVHASSPSTNSTACSAVSYYSPHGGGSSVPTLLFRQNHELSVVEGATETREAMDYFRAALYYEPSSISQGFDKICHLFDVEKANVSATKTK